MDPKAIVNRGSSYDIWISDDWNTVEDVKKSGLRQVRAIDVTYADGTKATMVLDGSGQPIDRIRELPVDTNQQRIWQQQQTQANRPPEERNNNGRRERWNAQAGGWEDVGPAINTSTTATAQPGQTTQIEGTPTGDGQFDNERPVKVTRDQSGAVVKSEPLTPAEMTEWRNNRERSRNPGQQTDEEVRTQGQKDDTTVVSTGYTGTGKNRRKVTTYKSGRTVTEDAPTNATAISSMVEQRGGKTVKVTKYDDGTETVEDQGPGTSSTRTVERNGKTYIEHTVKKPDGTSDVYFTDQSGARVQLPDAAQIPANAPQFAPDWQKPGLGLIEYASAVRARPDMTDEQKAALIKQAHDMATSTVSQGNAVLSAQQAEGTRATTERGQNASMANQRLSSASSDFSTAARTAADATKYSEGPEAASVLPYYLAMARAAGQAYGGFETPPPVQTGAAIGQMQGQTIPGLASMLPVQGNAIGVDAAPPSFMTPGAAPDAAGAEAARQQAMANPVFRPQPPAQLPAPVAAGASPSPAMNAPAMAAPPAGNVPPGMMSPNPPDISAPPPPINMDPSQGPVGMQQGGALASMLGQAGPWAGAPQPPQPTGAGAMLMQRAGGYNANPINQVLLEAGIDPDVIQALGGVG